MTKRIQHLEAALDSVAKLLQRTDLTVGERERLVKEGELIAQKLNQLNAA